MTCPEPEPEHISLFPVSSFSFVHPESPVEHVPGLWGYLRNSWFFNLELCEHRIGKGLTSRPEQGSMGSES